MWPVITQHWQTPKRGFKRGRSYNINLPGKPSAVRECLDILAPAIREGVAHLCGENPH